MRYILWLKFFEISKTKRFILKTLFTPFRLETLPFFPKFPLSRGSYRMTLDIDRHLIKTQIPDGGGQMTLLYPIHPLYFVYLVYFPSLTSNLSHISAVYFLLLTSRILLTFYLCSKSHISFASSLSHVCLLSFMFCSLDPDCDFFHRPLTSLVSLISSLSIVSSVVSIISG